MPDWKQMAIEIAEYFREKYYSPDLDDLANFDGSSIAGSIPYLSLGICGGIFFAALVFYYNSEFLGRVVRKLYNTASFSMKDAKTLAQLGCDHPLIRRNLCPGKLLSRYVKSVEDIQTAKDCKTARFYLAEETKYIADKRYKAFYGGKQMLTLLLFLCAAAYFLLLYLLPDVFRFADNAMSMLKNG